MPITALNHFLLVSKNLERTKDFYCTVLGFEVAAERPDFGFPGYWLKANGEISVHLASQVPNKIRDQFLRRGNFVRSRHLLPGSFRSQKPAQPRSFGRRSVQSCGKFLERFFVEIKISLIQKHGFRFTAGGFQHEVRSIFAKSLGRFVDNRALITICSQIDNDIATCPAFDSGHGFPHVYTFNI